MVVVVADTHSKSVSCIEKWKRRASLTGTADWPRMHEHSVLAIPSANEIRELRLLFPLIVIVVVVLDGVIVVVGVVVLAGVVVVVEGEAVICLGVRAVLPQIPWKLRLVNVAALTGKWVEHHWETSWS